MNFDPPLVEASFVRRYKRFFLDARLPDGDLVTAHCPNTGSLLGCLKEGAPVLLQPVDKPGRKLRWTWKMIRIGRGWVGVDTGNANALVGEAIERGVIPQLTGYERIWREVKYGKAGRSRIDLLLSRGGQPDPRSSAPRGRRLYRGDERAYVEIKNTTLALGDGRAAFPDAVTERGRKHLAELTGVVKSGHRAVMIFSIQRGDCHEFVPADEIDPEYGKALRRAVRRGVEAYALISTIGPKRILLDRPIPVVL